MVHVLLIFIILFIIFLKHVIKCIYFLIINTSLESCHFTFKRLVDCVLTSNSTREQNKNKKVVHKYRVF